MAKSKLSDAAFYGRVDDVRALLKEKKGNRLDGKDGGIFDDDAEGCIRGAPYYLPLCEAARGGHPDVIEVLLEVRADINAIDYRNETPLIHAASEGHMAVVQLLIDRGADLDHVGCTGTALAYAFHSAHTAVALTLINAGANPNVGERSQNLLDQIQFKPSTLRDGDELSRRSAHAQLEILQALKRSWKDAPSRLTELLKAATDAKKNQKKSTPKKSAYEAQLARAGEADFVDEVMKLFPDELEDQAGYQVIKGVALELLADERAIAAPSWGTLLTTLLKLSWSYEDITLASYGEALTTDEMDDDEGGALDWYADEHLWTFDLCLTLLALEPACERDDWPDLVEAVCVEKDQMISYMSFGDEQVKSLFQQRWVDEHPARDRLKIAARKAFPYAGL